MLTRPRGARLPFGQAGRPAPSRERALGPFSGLSTGVGATHTDGSPSQRNVDTADGDLAWRLGYRSVMASVTDCTAVKCFQYFSTYTSSGTFMDGFVAVLRIAGAERLYEFSLNSSTDVWEAHEILFGGSSLDLATSFTRIVAFRDTVYIFNRDSAESGQDPGPLLTYTPGSYTCTAVKRPTAPTTLLGVNYAKNVSGGTAYNVVRWAGADPVDQADTNEVTYDGTIATSTGTALTGQNWEQEHTDNKGTAYVQFQLNNFTAGDQDLTNVDVLVFSLTVKTPASFEIDPNLVQFYLGDSDDGSAGHELTVTTFPQFDSSGQLTRVDCYAKFTNKTRASWAATRYVKIAYSVRKTSSTVGNNHLFISPITLGGVVDWVKPGEPTGIMAGYGFRNTTTGYKSGVGGGVELSLSLLKGDVYVPSKNSAETLFMGSQPVFTTTTSSEADKVRIYVARQVKSEGRSREFGKWRMPLDGEQNDTDTSYVFHTTADEFEQLSDETPDPFRHDDIVCAAVVGQYVAWGYQGGEQNVRLSRVGEALLQADPDDVLVAQGNTDDLARGATFSLTDDHTDSPKGFVPCGSVLIVLGEDGAYAMVDTGQDVTKGVPSSMSPPRRVPGAPGTLGFHSFWKGADKYGNPGVYYQAKDGGSVYFLQVFENFDGKSGFAIKDVSGEVRGTAFTDLLFGGSRLTDSSVSSVFVDPVDGALFVNYDTRCLKLQRPSALPEDKGYRKWGFYDFEEGQYASTWYQKVQAGQRGIFGIRLNGTVDEFFRANCKQSGSSERAIVPLDASAFTGTSNSGTERIGFTSPPGWTDGWGVQTTTVLAWLSLATTYYARRIDNFTYELYDTAANARNTGATTGRVNITTSVSVSLRPIGQDDGCVPVSAYWDSKVFVGPRRRAVRARVERESLTDTPTVTATGDRAAHSVTLVSGEKHTSRFGHTVSGQKLQYRVALAALSGRVQDVIVEEEFLDPRKSA